jgi:hypothetical protein
LYDFLENHPTKWWNKNWKVEIKEIKIAVKEELRRREN